MRGFVQITPFKGNATESFETIGSFSVPTNTPVFGGAAVVHGKPSASLFVMNTWLFKSQVWAADGAVFLGSSSSWVQYDFASPASAFGGYFTTNSDVAGGRMEFYRGGVLVSTQTMAVPTGGVWTWNGWSSEAGFDAVRVVGNSSSGGYVMQDDLRFMVIPGPGPCAVMAGPGLLCVWRRRRA